MEASLLNDNPAKKVVNKCTISDDQKWRRIDNNVEFYCPKSKIGTVIGHFSFHCSGCTHQRKVSDLKMKANNIKKNIKIAGFSLVLLCKNSHSQWIRLSQ